MCMKTRLCKSKRCVEGRLFTVNTHHSPFASVKPMFSDTISNVKSCILRRVRKLRRAVVHCFDYDKHADIMLKVAHRHVFVSEKKYTQPSFSARTRTQTRLVVDTFAWKHGKRKRTCIAPIVSISTTKRSDVDHTELPANTPHLPFLRISIRYRAKLLLDQIKRKKLCHKLHRDTSFYVTIYTWRRLVSKKVA